MCGIAGLARRSPDPHLWAHVARMSQTLIHRGPDSGGVVAFDESNQPRATPLGGPDEPLEPPRCAARVALGARRLAVIGLDGGDQPMAAADGRAWIAYNGEIYNYIELRDELRSRGVAFRTSTDTEVALAAWRAWGPDCFARFDGMWGMAIYEPAQRRLTLSRDRFGIKPLYVARTADGIAFGSEIKAVLESPGVARRADLRAVADFLAGGLTDHTAGTFFKGVSALAPGARMTVTWRDGNIETAVALDQVVFPCVRRDDDVLTPDASHEAVVDRLRGALDRGCGRHMRSDVAVGTCLSGGLDSATIVATIHRLARGDGADGGIAADVAANWSQSAYTAVLPGDALDESRYARIAAHRAPGLQQHEIRATANGLLNDLDRLMWHQEQPFGGPSIYMQWEVMKRARAEGTVVLLDGQGGDELFGGYPGFLTARAAELMRTDSLRAAWRVSRATEARGHYRPVSFWAHTFAHALSADRRARWRARRDGRRNSWVSPALVSLMMDGVRERGGSGAEGGRTRASSSRFDLLGRFDSFRMDLILRTSLPPLLRYEDRNSMAFSIEARVPLLGRDVSDVALDDRASRWLMGDGRTKSLLRDAARDRVPAEIVDRTDKIGFAAPTATWMAGPLREWWRDMSAAARGADRGWVRVDALERLGERVERGDVSAALAMWRAAIVEAWARKWLVGGG
jgi:asparagine synthase (glutamine-hydrolysing)